MNRKELFTEINSLCREMDDRYSINYGGCCYVAAVIAENLKKFNIPFKVIEYFSPCHYVVEVSDRQLNGIPECSKGKCRFEYVDEDINLFDLYYSQDWNYTYSRRWNLIVITRITALFNKYGNTRK